MAASLFQKFQEFVKTLAKSPTFARDPRKLQYEADINRLFLCTSYNRLGNNAEETDIEEIIDMASRASFSDQEKLVQENVHSQIKSFCMSMDQVLIDTEKRNKPLESPQKSNAASHRSGLSFAIGRNSSPTNHPDVHETRPLRRAEVSQKVKDLMGYTLEIKPSQIPHKEAGQGLFLNGEADVGTVVAFYPGVTYSPAYYRFIPGYPKVDAKNPYLITRYDGTVINAQPWGFGDETREVWDALTVPKVSPNVEGDEKGSDRFWRLLSKPLEGKRVEYGGDVIERRNPLAFAHYANHPAKGVAPNVLICPYDFPLSEKDMRVYIPNVVFGNLEDTNMKRFGNFWFKYGSSKNMGSDVPLLRTLVLVAMRALCDEEVLLNYRLSNLKRQPEWYTPVDEEEDRRRWS
ncbi:C5orf [Parasponia andersonii]|uniref:C5orf n=1 Tax=Parasponia andersonii TaxID=3476 RepID=A0A2P5AEH2_PARAD|nr:C5orf [Parasponia andersonii]